MPEFDFDPELVAFITRARLRILRDAGAVFVMGSDFRYEVHAVGEGFELRYGGRDDPAYVVAQAHELIDVERLLMLSMRGDLRRAAGFPKPAESPTGDVEADGFSGERVGIDVVVHDSEGVRMRFERVAAHDRDWVKWTYLADRPLAELAERLTTRAGW